LAALAGELVRVDSRAGALLNEPDPRTTAELLLDWERVTGLAAADQAGRALAERREDARSRLAEDGDVSGAGWSARAARLGHAITWTEFTPSRCGVMVCGDELTPELARFVLQINAPVVLTHPAECGALVCGDELGAYNTQRLEAELKRVKQAHTDLYFKHG
jgi:uncharacterized protein YmfQ (DUF2313 family)